MQNTFLSCFRFVLTCKLAMLDQVGELCIILPKNLSECLTLFQTPEMAVLCQQLVYTSQSDDIGLMGSGVSSILRSILRTDISGYSAGTHNFTNVFGSTKCLIRLTGTRILKR